MRTAPYQTEPEVTFLWADLAHNVRDALGEIEAKLATLTTWDEVADLHDEGAFEIMHEHGADFRDCDEFDEVYDKVKARLEALSVSEVA